MWYHMILPIFVFPIITFIKAMKNKSFTKSLIIKYCNYFKNYVLKINEFNLNFKQIFYKNLFLEFNVSFITKRVGLCKSMLLQINNRYIPFLISITIKPYWPNTSLYFLLLSIKFEKKTNLFCIND